MYTLVAILTSNFEIQQKSSEIRIKILTNNKQKTHFGGFFVVCDTIYSMFSRKSLVIFAVLLIFVTIFLCFARRGGIKEVIVGNNTFYVEVARTKMELERGLSLHVPLLRDQGMLFIFEKEDFYSFWMKDMLFPVDILWIDSNFKVVHAEKSVLPETYPKSFYPKSKSLYVLEISAGLTEALNIKIGDEVKFIK